jgi:hypothetical protein
MESQGGGDTVALHQRLQAAAEEKNAVAAELAARTEELNVCKTECARLRDAIGSGDGGDMGAAMMVERELREQAEQRAEKERSDRLAAEVEWNSMSEQVVQEVDGSRRQVDELVAKAREAENKLVESRAETRKAQLMIAEAKGTLGSNYDIRVTTCVKGECGGV